MTSKQVEPADLTQLKGTIKVENLESSHSSSKSSWLGPAFGITNDKIKIRKKVQLFPLVFRLGQVPAGASATNARPLRSSRI